MRWDKLVDIAAFAHELARIVNCLVRPQGGLGEIFLFHDGQRIVWVLD